MDCIIKIPEHLDIIIDIDGCPSIGSVFYVAIKDTFLSYDNKVLTALRKIPLGWIINHESDDFSDILKKVWFTFAPNNPTYVVGKFSKIEYQVYEFKDKKNNLCLEKIQVTKYKYLPKFFISDGKQL
jgi:hypothetical protein